MSKAFGCERFFAELKRRHVFRVAAAYPIGFATLIVAVLLALAAPVPVAAQEQHSHEQEAGHHTGLHFSHPLVTESVSPDTKMRLDVGRAWESGVTETTIEVEGEYAFHRAFSVGLTLPYAIVDPSGGGQLSGVGNAEIGLKFANYAFDAVGLLLGYGIEFGLPTGDAARGIGSDHIWEVAPFLSVGYKRSRVELVGFSTFGIPFNQEPGEEVETELLYDVAGLVHLAPWLQALVEVNAETVLSGEEAGASTVWLSPGLKVAPIAGVPLFAGLGASLPLTEEELDVSLRLTLFFHF